MLRHSNEAVALLATCKSSGVALWLEGEQLRYSGVAHQVDPLLPELQKFKPQLFELLAHTKRKSSPAENALFNLARLRDTRRYDFGEAGQRIFHARGRHVSLTRELIAEWKRAEAAVGKRLTIWGNAHEELPQIPEELTLVEYGQARTICERHRSLWCSMTREEQHQLAVSIALLNAGYDLPHQQTEDHPK